MTQLRHSPGRATQRIDDHHVLLCCPSCGVHVPIEKVDGTAITPTEELDALTTWQHDCGASQ